ncbi:Arp2/3 complex 34 kDa subunit [Rhizoctonia solani]|uniref:Arp2/3 complex 34 kDa subunit n=1 Tax=Rhizoctonia solani TaxID=456999 RepID=A0A8H7M4L6_9AGAM|nr:Arp2/3 complex 34 kDa subunit [Rhizoctonia solani]
MILLESHNVVLQNTLNEKFNKPSGIDVSFVDYDGVRFHVSTPEKKTELLVSISMRCWEELVQYGANDVLQREYGSFITEPEQGYNFSLRFDLENVPAAGGVFIFDEIRVVLRYEMAEERDNLIKSVALLKRNALAAPFEAAFATQKELEAAGMPTDGSAPPTGDLKSIHYRDREAIYVRAGIDRVTVVFSTEFQDETDKVVGRVFLQEFVDARRQPSIQTAPQVLYSNREPPLEIRGVQGLNVSDDVGYVTFVIFPRHFSNPVVAANTISHIQLFRDYLHYHIKCSKAYMHSRMRHRVTEFLKVLNRAKTESVGEKERKTVTGRTFSSR